ncbi:hypothetical protein [Pleionea sediminis]|uniref:hypothetical protein n=1 Tax=Pleionea sediminis TaxID=2569479 RepID=UPI001186C70C|nr:hypothetical protein [Pleionea sediminis]
MILEKQVFIDGRAYTHTYENIRLSSSMPGAATFILTEKPEGQMLQYHIGYDSEGLFLYFTGIVVSTLLVSNNYYEVKCLELTSLLNCTFNFNVKTPTLRQVCSEFSQRTGLLFDLPFRKYMIRKISISSYIGHGYHLMNSFGSLFNIPMYTWHQRQDGMVFVGSQFDAPSYNKTSTLNNDWYVTMLSGNVAETPPLPEIRPGVNLSGLGIVESVTILQSIMKIRWK